MKRIALAAIMAGALLTSAQAEIKKQSFNVVGLWNIGPMYKEFEAPLFGKFIPEASGGKISADVKSITDLGLKGFETIKLLKDGLFDVGFGAYVYTASGNPVFEGIDLAMAPNGAAQARKLVNAYKPVAAEAFAKVHGLKLLANYPYPAQVMVCTKAFSGLDDLKGRKIRVYSTTLGDMAEGLGGVSASIPLSDVVPALQRGVIDCGVSSGTSMYKGKWHEVVKYMYETPVSAGIGYVAMTMKKWESLDADTQALLSAEAAKYEDRTWAALDESAAQGIACLTGEGVKCRYGEPAGMTLVKASKDDDVIRKKMLSDFVLKRYAKRCGAECTARWNATAGAVVGVEAKE